MAARSPMLRGFSAENTPTRNEVTVAISTPPVTSAMLTGAASAMAWPTSWRVRYE